MLRFCEYEFQKYVKNQIAEGTRYTGPTNNSDEIDRIYDRLSAHELVYYLGEFLTEEEEYDDDPY